MDCCIIEIKHLDISDRKALGGLLSKIKMKKKSGIASLWESELDRFNLMKQNSNTSKTITVSNHAKIWLFVIAPYIRYVTVTIKDMWNVRLYTYIIRNGKVYTTKWKPGEQGYQLTIVPSEKGDINGTILQDSQS
jgi:hypothetical protein